MKKYFIIHLLFACFCLTVVAANADEVAGERVELSYKVIRIPGPGSNQIAVWIEDGDGNYVRSLYASKFTADGGYVRRPVSLSEWVEKSDWANASKEEIDAVSGSTQTDGEEVTLIWDLTDKNGKKVAPGKYIIRMEANIKNEKKMFWSGEIVVGDDSSSVAPQTITYSESGLENGDQLFKDVQLNLVQ
ncbi:MAG: DUF2271 domain-containing protein [Rikenellaceae bacterium]|nr:DUF2271 domain-containing protein [Rikenellaceae bacterium]